MATPMVATAVAVRTQQPEGLRSKCQVHQTVGGTLVLNDVHQPVVHRAETLERIPVDRDRPSRA
jgi:hypothetical protein